MSDEIKVNRPVVSQPQPSSQPMAESAKPAARSSKAPWVILIVVVLVLLVGGFLMRDTLFGKKDAGSVKGTSVTKENMSGYQAVFLTNGQVYFGKIMKGKDNDYITLSDIYYLQVGPQQGSGAATTSQQSISLVKLGQELHGPVDEMHISKTQVLFYEDLKTDGQVVKAIEQDKAAKK